MSCECGEKFNVETTQRGTIVKCPACSNGVKVPDDRGGKSAPRPVLAEVEPEEDDPRIVFDCPKCGNAMKARVSYAGRSTLCPKCQASVTIPDKETRHSGPAKKSSVMTTKDAQKARAAKAKAKAAKAKAKPKTKAKPAKKRSKK